MKLSQGLSQKVVSTSFVFNSLPARGDFCFLLITFANSLDPGQTRQGGSVVEYRRVLDSRQKGLRVQASPASLCCVLEQGTLSLL